MGYSSVIVVPHNHKNMHKAFYFCIILLAILPACQQAQSHTSGDFTTELPSRRDLQRQAWKKDTWLVVYQSTTSEKKAAYESILQPLQEMKSRGVQVRVMSLDAAPDSLLQNYPVILVSTNLDPFVKTHLNTIPALSFETDSFQIGDLLLDQSQDFAQLTYLPSPWSAQLPMYLIWANDFATLQQNLKQKMSAGLRSFLWSSWGYEIVRNQETHCLGYFNDSTWVMDKKIHFEFDPDPKLLQDQAAAQFWAFDGAQPQLDDWSAQLDSIQLDIQDFTAATALAPLQLYFYPTAERKALATNSMEQAHIKKNQVHLVSNAYFQGEEWGEHLRLWLREALGEATNSFIEQGLALQWSPDIRGRNWRDWVYHLALADALPNTAMLYKEKELAQQAPLIGRLAAAAWVEYCLQKVGKATFLETYQQGKAPLPTHQQQTKNWKAWIQETYARSPTPRTPLPQERLDGFTLAHEGYRIYNGYGGARARQSLELMSSDGIDAIAIVPYSYMQNPNQATPIPVARGAGTENDEACLFSHFSAKDLGQFTMLKPQIWLGGGSWPGDVTFDTAAEWKQFFIYYRRWIMHYALLAEMYGVDALCTGTELRYTTLKQPEEWQKLLSDIRKIYHGAITYAANWGEECEQITFWEDVDFIGVNAYYPLHKKEEATDEELLAGAEKMLSRIGKIQQASQRPVWLTEVGYRSAASPWMSPHAEAKRRSIDVEGQARCYEALFSAAEDVDWLKGFFWWKWPANLEHNESDGRGYMPLGKPAEEVLRKYYLSNE